MTVSVRAALLLRKENYAHFIQQSIVKRRKEKGGIARKAAEETKEGNQ
jgi:hypothetical protein